MFVNKQNMSYTIQSRWSPLPSQLDMVHGKCRINWSTPGKYMNTCDWERSMGDVSDGRPKLAFTDTYYHYSLVDWIKAPVIMHLVCHCRDTHSPFALTGKILVLDMHGHKMLLFHLLWHPNTFICNTT